MLKKLPKPQNSLGSIFVTWLGKSRGLAEAEVERLPPPSDREFCTQPESLARDHLEHHSAPHLYEVIIKK